jgi:hypothetical protein
VATSGSVDFSVSRDNLIEDAMRLTGALAPEDSASTAQKTHAARVLNIIAKAWTSYGIGLWVRKTGYILPQTDTNEILLGPTGNHATLSYTQTTLASAAASGATTITVNSATGILTTYNIGVELSTGDMHWTTVNGAPAGTVVTLTAALPSAASADGYVWVYQTKLQRPIRIIEAYVRNEDSDAEWEIDVVAKSEYEAMGIKTSAGIPNIISYEPSLGDGKAYIYPQISNGNTLIKVVFQRPFEDFDAAADTPDFPQEAYRALMYALAVDLSPTYGLPVEDRRALKSEAVVAFSELRMNEPEEGSLMLQPSG